VLMDHVSRGSNPPTASYSSRSPLVASNPKGPGAVAHSRR
jgi:hypothetical protein